MIMKKVVLLKQGALPYRRWSSLLKKEERRRWFIRE